MEETVESKTVAHYEHVWYKEVKNKKKREREREKGEDLIRG